jgi:hypothetical protein
MSRRFKSGLHKARSPDDPRFSLLQILMKSQEPLMAAVNALGGLPPERGKFARSAFAKLSSPWFWSPLVLALAMPYWASPVLYFYLWAFLRFPNGVVAWVAAMLAVGVSIVASCAFFCAVVVYGRTVRRSKEDLAMRVPGAAEDLVMARFGKEKAVKLHYYTIFAVAIQMVIPPIAALEIWSAFQTPMGRLAHGKLEVFTPRDQLNTELDAFKQRGVFRPFPLH